MLKQLDWKIALRTGIGAALTWVIDQQLTEYVGWTDRTISGLWAVISAIIVLQSNLGGGYLEGYKRFVGIFVGSLFGGLATTWLGWQPLHLAVSLFLTVLLMGALKLQDSTRIACLSCAVIMVVWSLNPVGSPWTFAAHRFVDSTLGLVIGLLISHFLFPSETTKTLVQNKKSIFSLFSTSLMGGTLDPLKQANDLLKKDEELLKELQAEWTRDSSSKEHWETLHAGEKTLLNLLTTATTLQKEEVFSLLDPSLFQNTKEALISLSSSFENIGDGKSEKIPLLDVIKKLKTELVRYREIKATRSFSFQQLENYFVFYYTLEELLLETYQLQELL